MSLVWAAPAFFFAAIYVSAAYAQVQALAGSDLRATAGYRNDAWRWLEEAQEAIQRSGVPRRAIVRER